MNGLKNKQYSICNVQQVSNHSVIQPNNLMFIDTHAHLFYPNFAEDIDEVIERAKSSSVDYIIVPSTDIETAKQTLALADKYEMIYATVGVHPHETKEWNNKN